MTAKQAFIQSQSQASGIIAPNTLWGYLNDLVEIDNPVAQGQVSISIPIIEIGASLLANDRRLLQNEGAYKSLFINIDKNDLLSVGADIENLITTPGISQGAVNVLNAVLVSAGNTQPDPNWSSKVWVKRCVAAGFDLVSYEDVVGALA